MNQLQRLKKALIAYVNSVKAVWSAIAHPLSIVSKRKSDLKDYRIYGNSVQEYVNLYDASKATKGLYIDDTGVEQTSSQISLSDFMEAVGGASYVLEVTNTYDGKSNLRVNYFNSEKVWLSQAVYAISPYSTLTKSVAIPDDVAFIRTSFYSGGTQIIYRELSPDNPIEVQSVGELTTKNLLDAKTYYQKYANDNGGITLHTGELWDFVYYDQKTLDGVFKENTRYTFSCKYNITEAETSISPQIWYTDGTRTYMYIGVTGTTGTGVGEGTLSLTSTAGKTVEKFNFTYGSNSKRFEGKLTEMQIEEGTTATEYEPYHKYKVPVTVRGKNLLDKDTAKLLRVASGTKVDRTETGISHKLTNAETMSYSFWDLGAMKDYVGKTVHAYFDVSRVGEESYRNSFFVNYDAVNNKRTEIGERTISGNKVHLVVTINGNYTEERLSLRLYATSGSHSPEGTIYNFENIMVFIGEDGDGTYEPYIEPQTHNIYLDEPLRKVGDYADVVDFEKGVVVRNVEKKVFDGTENWVFDVSTNNNGLEYRENVATTISLDAAKKNILSSRVRALTWNSLWQNYYKTNGATNLTVGCSCVYNKSDKQLYLKVTPYSTLPTIAEWKAQLATWYAEGNPFTVWYVIPTAETPINRPKLPQFKGTTIYEVNQEIPPSGMEVCYYE